MECVPIGTNLHMTSKKFSSLCTANWDRAGYQSRSGRSVSGSRLFHCMHDA